MMKAIFSNVVDLAKNDQLKQELEGHQHCPCYAIYIDRRTKINKIKNHADLRLQRMLMNNW